MQDDGGQTYFVTRTDCAAYVPRSIRAWTCPTGRRIDGVTRAPFLHMLRIEHLFLHSAWAWWMRV